MTQIPYDVAVFSARNRERVYETVIQAIEQEAARTGVTRKDIAQRIGRKAPQVTAWLSGPSNWTLDTVSDLLRAVGATMDYEVVFDRDRRASNVFNASGEPPAWATAPAPKQSTDDSRLSGLHTQIARRDLGNQRDKPNQTLLERASL